MLLWYRQYFQLCITVGEMVATGAVDVGEIECKSLSQLQKDEKESLKQERIDNMFMNLSAAETVIIVAR